MDELANEWHEQLARGLCQLASSSTSEPLDPFVEAISWERDGKRLSLIGQAAEDFLELVSDTAQALSDKCSESLITDRLVETLFAARFNGEAEALELTLRLKAEYESWTQETQVYLPVLGLDVLMGRLSIGGVTLLQIKENDVANPGTFRRDRTAQLTAQRRNLDWMVGKVCALIRVSAETERAIELAELRTRRALDTLMYANTLIYPFRPQGDAVVSLERDRAGRTVHALAVTGEHTVEMTKSPPNLWPIVVSWEIAHEMRKFGVGELSRLLLQPSDAMSELERRILTAVHWLGYSRTQRDPSGEFACLFVALESMIPKFPGKMKDIRRLSLGVAKILGQDEDGRVFDRLKRLYRQRTDVVHEGKTESTAADAQELRWYVARVIFVLLVNRHLLVDIAGLASRLWSEEGREEGQLLQHPLRQLAPVVGTGRSIYDLRIARGMTRSELARRVSPYTTEHDIDYWENQVISPDLIELQRLAKALSIDVQEFEFGETQQLVSCDGRLFLLEAHRSGSHDWRATVKGWSVPQPDNDVSESDCGEVDESRPGEWSTSGATAGQALDRLVEIVQEHVGRRIQE